MAEAMVWCIEHAEAGEEIIDCISESLSILQTPLTKKIARLYLISDILHNCSVKGVPNVSYYRKGFQTKLPEVFSDLNQCYSNIESRIRAEAFKQRVMNCFRAWEDWALYPQDFLIKLQNIFLGFVMTAANKEDIKEPIEEQEPTKDNTDEEDDDDVDGVPLDGAAFLKAAQKSGNAGASSKRPLVKNDDSEEDSDVDGVPLDQNTSNNGGNILGSMQRPSKPIKTLPAGFVPSRWETVDPEDVQAQAVTSKWDIFDHDEAKKEDDDDDLDGIPLHDDSIDASR